MHTVRIAFGLLLALLGALALMLAEGDPTNAEDSPMVSLSPGEHAFWHGPYVDHETVGSGDLCGIVGPCWTYGVTVERGNARRLRVAIDWPSSENMYELDLIDPSGEVVGTMSGYGSWNDELFAKRPAPGIWKVRVVPEDVTASSFKMRAKLEAQRRGPARGGARRVMLPNLQVNAPWDATLVGPAAIGPTALLIHRPADVLGFHPRSCSPDESLMNGTEKCLRFSVGPMNISPGPLELAMDLAEARPNGQGHLEGPATQRLYRRDGSYKTRPAGTFIAHEQHLHFHVQALLEYKLLRVTDLQSGKMEPAGAGNKASFCTLDLMIPFFRRFTSEGPKFRGPQPCAVPPEGDTKLVMGISPGWADVYTWDLPDQYVDFGAGGEGYFVIRARVDPHNTVLETDDDDNYGYGLVRITGDEVETLERGIGRSPWDPHKRILPLAP